MVRIYRRTYDSSGPVPETSRYTIDRLVENGREVTKRFERFCRDERTFSRSEEGTGWVKIFLSPYPLGTIEKFNFLSSLNIEKLLERSKIPTEIKLKGSTVFSSNIPFNSGQPTYQSVILRQITPGGAAFNSLMTELFVDGRAKFFIPLEIVKPYRVRQVSVRLKEFDHIVDNKHLRFFDIGKMCLVVACLLSYYKEWIGEESWSTDLQVSVIGEDVWRSVPFFDSEEWLVHVKKYGLPVLHTDSIRIPEETGRGALIDLHGQPTLWSMVCSYIGLGFGLPLELYWKMVFEAVQRAAQIPKTSNEN